MDRDYKLYVIEGLNTDTNTMHGKFFMGMIGLRISGYKKIYGFRSMPVDIYDHFSKHLLLSECIDGHEFLIACVRFVSLKDCKKHEAVFLPLARVSDYPKNEVLIDSLIDTIKNRKESDIYYNSSLTVSPSIKSLRQHAKILKTIIGAALNYHQYLGNKNWLTSAPIKVRTDKLFKRIGYEPFCTDPYYLLKTLNDEKTIMFKHENENETYKKWLHDTKKLWDKRTILTK